jgi:hypothetical protein
MALLPTGIIVVPTGTTKTITPVEVIGGVVIGVSSATDTSAGSPITETFLFKKNGIKPVYSAPIESTDAGSAYNATTALSSTGTFAYNQDQFMIKGVATNINNTASTALAIGGMSDNRPHKNDSNKSKGAKTSTAYRTGYWRALGISGQRTNWSVSPTTNNVDYVLPTDNTTAAVDQAIYVTYKAVPGELAYMDGSPNPIQDEYKPRSG